MSDKNADLEICGGSLPKHPGQSAILGVVCLTQDAAAADDDDDPPHERKLEEKLSSPTSPPTSSCQALKHAVSALTHIDDFLLEELGGGFFANIYKATHRLTGEQMVMKINKDYANRSAALREIQLMNRLSHPNILRFLGVCVHEGQLHALTEYVSGGTLEALLANQEEELPWILRIKLSLDISEGLHYLHCQGVFHRDLTSMNILIKKGDNKKYQAVIADFGLATQIPDAKVRQVLPPVGCPWWMAPEVIHGKFYDQRADVFSFGIILLEITARIEADPQTMPRTKNFGVDYVKICELVDYCPLDFLQLAFKCCQIVAEQRPSSEVIKSTLERIYTSLHAQNHPQTSTEKLRKRSKSEDNIIQLSESAIALHEEEEVEGEEFLMTIENVAQAMSKDDPDYCPATDNPFADIIKLKDGRKLCQAPPRRRSGHICGIGMSTPGHSHGVGMSSPGHSHGVGMSSPGHSHGVGMSSPGHSHGVGILAQVCGCLVEKPQSQSLPPSPILLRKAAEKLHLASLLGSEAMVKEEQRQQQQLVSVSNDSQTDSDIDISADDRRGQFHGGRTRSLGSLDLGRPRCAFPASQQVKCGFDLQRSETAICGYQYRPETANSVSKCDLGCETLCCMDDQVTL